MVPFIPQAVQSGVQFSNKVVLYRVDLNVPVKGGDITDDQRIRAMCEAETLHFLIEAGAKVLILTHMGRYKEGKTPQSTRILLKPIVEALRWDDLACVNTADLTDPELASRVAALAPGEGILLGNSRQTPRDETNDPAYAEALVHGVDYVVYDAWGAGHRDQASTTGIMRLKPSFVGQLVERELRLLQPYIGERDRSVAVVGGGKLKEKIGALEGLLKMGWEIVLGGVPLNVALRVGVGIPVGDSCVTEDGKSYESAMRSLYETYGHRISIPSRIGVVESGENATLRWLLNGEAVPDGGRIVDVSYSDIELAGIRASSRILLVGPLGLYEEGYVNGTDQVVAIMREHQTALALGADTTAATRFSRNSTGGGASLEYIVNGTLPILDV
jgi:phosphoglycerate kinase